MLKFSLILSVISSTLGYDYSHVRPTYFYSPHHPIYQPSYQLGPLLNYPSYQPFYKYVGPHPLPVNRVADQVDQIQSRLFFGKQLSGVFSRGEIKGKVTVLQNTFMGNSGNNAVFSLSLNDGTSVNSTYTVLLLEDDFNVDIQCGAAADGDRTTQYIVDGNQVLAETDNLVAEIVGAYDVKRAGIFLKGSLLKHNVDGKGTYEGTYPSPGYLNYFNEFYTIVTQVIAALVSALSGVPVQGVYTPATQGTISGNKMSAAGKWVLVNKFNVDPTQATSIGCAKLE